MSKGYKNCDGTMNIDKFYCLRKKKNWLLMWEGSKNLKQYVESRVYNKH
jgi:hypothetical protein